MSFINNVLSRINMAEFLAMISKWWTCIIDSACALYILKKSRINIVRLFWIRAQSYVGILKMYCTFVFGLCIINPVTSMDHSTFEKCTCIINPACPFCHLHHFWRNLVPPVVVPVLLLWVSQLHLDPGDLDFNFYHGQRVPCPRPLTPRRPVSHGNLSTIIEKRCCTVNVREHF